MTAREKRNNKAIRTKAIFLTSMIYCAILGGVLIYTGGGESTITDKVKTYFQRDVDTDQSAKTIHAA